MMRHALRRVIRTLSATPLVQQAQVHAVRLVRQWHGPRGPGPGFQLVSPDEPMVHGDCTNHQAPGQCHGLVHKLPRGAKLLTSRGARDRTKRSPSAPHPASIHARRMQLRTGDGRGGRRINRRIGSAAKALCAFRRRCAMSDVADPAALTSSFPRAASIDSGKGVSDVALTPTRQRV
jgi:hypothetical protein